MKATAITVGVDGSRKVEALDRQPTLKFLQGAVGGHIEVVPGFVQIEHEGRIERCVAFCNEEGKLDGLPLNPAATTAWHDALPDGLWRRDRTLADVLVGPVLIIFGDAEFMAEL